MLDIPALMVRAIALAERGGGGTAPNPMVGCVIADETGRILGEGYHERAGGPHAEVAAMEAARRGGHALRGATFVVSLEPCAAHGRTPPCVDAIVAAGVRRVRYATEDPAHGKGGAARLRAAGIEAEAGPGERQARRLNEAWLHFVATGRPFFHVKVARTSSGHVTRGTGGGRWITGPAARAVVHRLRRRCPAVLVGVGTVLADDPELTVRDWPPGGAPAGSAAEAGDLGGAPVQAALEDAAPDVAWPDVQPRRVVLDARLRIPLEARLVATAGAAPVTVFTSAGADPRKRSALEARGVEVVAVPEAPGGLELASVASELAARDVTGVLVEPGPALLTALAGARLVDRWTTFTSPDSAVEADALPGAVPAGLSAGRIERERVGEDLMETSRLAPEPIF